MDQEMPRFELGAFKFQTRCSTTELTRLVSSLLLLFSVPVVVVVVAVGVPFLEPQAICSQYLECLSLSSMRCGKTCLV